MAFDGLEDVLHTCLDEMARGAKLQDVLMKHPAEADALRPLLTAAETMRRHTIPARAPAAIERGRSQLQQAVRMAARARLPRRTRRIAPLARYGAVAGALFIALMSGAVYAESALPGDMLYSWKLGSEELRYRVAPTAAERAAVGMWVADRRLAEVTSLARQHRLDVGDLASLSAEDALIWQQIEMARPAQRLQLQAAMAQKAVQQSETLTAAATATSGKERQLLLLGAARSADAAKNPFVEPVQPGPAGDPQATTTPLPTLGATHKQTLVPNGPAANTNGASGEDRGRNTSNSSSQVPSGTGATQNQQQGDNQQGQNRAENAAQPAVGSAAPSSQQQGDDNQQGESRNGSQPQRPAGTTLPQNQQQGDDNQQGESRNGSQPQRRAGTALPQSQQQGDDKQQGESRNGSQPQRRAGTALPQSQQQGDDKQQDENRPDNPAQPITGTAAPQSKPTKQSDESQQGENGAGDNQNVPVPTAKGNRKPSGGSQNRTAVPSTGRGNETDGTYGSPGASTGGDQEQDAQGQPVPTQPAAPRTEPTARRQVPTAARPTAVGQRTAPARPTVRPVAPGDQHNEDSNGDNGSSNATKPRTSPVTGNLAPIKPTAGTRVTAPVQVNNQQNSGEEQKRPDTYATPVPQPPVPAHNQHNNDEPKSGEVAGSHDKKPSEPVNGDHAGGDQ
ncbi:MAG: hypothetical protein NVSMB42_17980 [Herpetosiphon sp.]